MSQTLPTLQALEQAAHYPGDGSFILHFAADVIGTPKAPKSAKVTGATEATVSEIRFTLRSGVVTNLASPTLPDWQTYLHSKGITAPLARTIREEYSARPLLEEGGYSESQLLEFCQERLLYAFLPVLEQNATLEIQPSPPNEQAPEEHGNLSALLPTLRQLSKSSGVFGRNLLPTTRFVANPLLPAEPLPSSAAGVYRAALRELNLGQISAQLPLRWDELSRAVSLLLTRKALFAAKPSIPPPTAPMLNAGQLAPDFCLPQLRGPEVRLSEQRGSKVWLIFNRQATCGLCVPRHEQLLRHASALQQRGIKVLSVWGSPLEHFQNGIGQQYAPRPFYVLADHYKLVFARYGVQIQFGAALDPRNLRHLGLMVRGLEILGLSQQRLDGEGSRLPAEFLINEQGVIEVAHYNRYATDWLATEQVLAWATSNPSPNQPT